MPRKYIFIFYDFYSCIYFMKFKRLLLLLIFAAFPSFAEYQQQWFSQFQELDGNINFVCESQCVVLVGPLAWNDSVTLNGTIQGSGVMWYGFVVGQQIVPGETFQIDWSTTINQQFFFSKLPFYSQIPQDAQIVFIAQGAIAWTQLKIDLWFMAFSDKVGQWWKDFWKMETLTPYTINLRYWVKILWTSIVKYGYWIFLLAGLYLFFFTKWSKEKKYRKICFLALGIFLFIGIRNLITYTWIVDQGIESYTRPSMEHKTYFDLWDYIAFTDQIRKTLKLDTEKKSYTLYVDSFQDWPFQWHRNVVYLQPCVWTLTWSEADYLIYYKKPILSWDAQKPVLVDFNGSYLLSNK